MSDASIALPETRAVRRVFDRAAATFASASVVHDEARERLLGRLDWMRLDPAVVADVGAGLGGGARGLAARYPQARVLMIDSSTAMLRAAASAGGGAAVAADAERLPVNNGALDLIFANMLLPWSRPDRVFGEAARTLTGGGPMLFATLGPDTLEQLRRAWAAVDDSVHVHAFFDMHDLGDLAVAAGLSEPVVDVDRLELSYRDVDSMIRDLRASGAVNVAAGRRRGLTGRRRWSAFERHLTSGRRRERFSVTIELILGHAWGTGRPRSRSIGPGEAAVPVEDIGRRRQGRAAVPPPFPDRNGHSRQ